MDESFAETFPDPVPEAANAPHAPSGAVLVDAASLPLEEQPGYGTARWRTLFDADRTATSEMVVGIAEFGPHATLLPHRHAPAEVYVCMSGEGTVTVDGAEHVLRAGVALFVPADAEHGVVAGPEGLSFTYVFPRSRFSEVEYRFTASAVA
ncbi:cupin domain-containing protein [Histidinibacterium lentulum]|uniref:Cupin domain-containing protein n=1 Tax=Histidinibacterium lentulum TaxID=2480588 RepID=A0A3N2R179_9RHOB|nr:cupin domain-containing protein [Histidinibacterium lentulum]ROU01088.1 cupin domain-containing protein [Histidinibacterium lentulum]